MITRIPTVKEVTTSSRRSLSTEDQRYKNVLLEIVAEDITTRWYKGTKRLKLDIHYWRTEVPNGMDMRRLFNSIALIEHEMQEAGWRVWRSWYGAVYVEPLPTEPSSELPIPSSTQ